MNGNFVYRLYGDKFCIGLAVLRALRQLGYSALTFSTLVEEKSQVVPDECIPITAEALESAWHCLTPLIGRCHFLL